MKKLTVAISAVAASVLMAMSAQAAEIYNKDSNKLDLYGKVNAKEGANKRGNSSRLTQSFHFFMFEPIFSPVNALNQPI